MAHFYGQLKGQTKTPTTRTGSRRSGIAASIQSWKGSLTVELNQKYDTEPPILTIKAAEGSKFGGETIFEGTIEELQKKLK